MPSVPQETCQAPLVHLGIADRFYKRRTPLQGQVRCHDPNGYVPEENQMSSWQRRPRNHEDIVGLVRGSSLEHRFACAKPPIIVSRLWNMLGYALPVNVKKPSWDVLRLPVEGLYKKSGPLLLFPNLNLPLPFLDLISTQILYPSPHLLRPLLLLLARASTHFDIHVIFLPSSSSLSSAFVHLRNTYDSLEDSGSFLPPRSANPPLGYDSVTK